MRSLYPHQEKILADVRRHFADGVQHVLIQGATGVGKNFMVAHYVHEQVLEGRRVVFAAHLDALLEDLADRLAANGVPLGLVQGDRPANADAPVQIASIQTIHARNARPAADLLIIDEAHRAAAPTVRAFIEAYPHARRLGATATPQRPDHAPLSDLFEAMVCGPQVRWLMERGFLVRCNVVAPSVQVEGALAADPVSAWFEHAENRRTIVFARNVLHAEDITRRLNAAGVSAECITGETSRAVRRGLRDRLASGESRVLVSVSVFLEGFDSPCIACVVLARPFGTCGAYLQAIGRGLRPWESKSDCLVIDLTGAVHLHGLPDDERRWSLDGEIVRRTGDSLQPIRRCRECGALFRPAARCPRCGRESMTATVLPRVLTRAERLELVSAIPQAERDRRYLAKLEWIARSRMHLSPSAATSWAHRQFAKRRLRDAEAA